MARIVWSPRARQDLRDIFEYIARDSEKYAALIVQQAFSLVERLPDQPQAGSIVPEYNRNDLRERLLHNFRVIYRLGEASIEVVSIVHGARILPEDAAQLEATE